ncbi:MAG: biotin--[acetyl-CoA-carboxylase] ligase [Clostridium sp.]
MALKHSVLKILEENREISISGEKLASELSVSRSAIWKAINTLKSEGYEIIAIRNKGYKLALNTDILSSEGITPFLKDDYKKNNILVMKSVGSTNKEAKKLCIDNTSHGTVLVANEQDSGKGRLGRKFFSPKDTGIYMSIILCPNIDISSAVLITTATSVAVCRAIRKVSNLNPEIKWVNDIFLNNKKICGILTEAITDFESGMVENIIIGIGLNFKTKKEQFPDELQDIAGSIFESDETEITRNNLVGEIINEVLNIYENLNKKDFLNEYKELSLVLGKDIKYSQRNKWHNAKAIDIDSNGSLIVKCEDGTIKTLNSGEISVRRITDET